MFTTMVIGEDIDVLNHWGRMTSTDSALKFDISILIKRLKSFNLWDKIGILCVVHDNSVDSLLNLKGVSTGAPDSSTIGSPSFVTDRGFTCAGASDVVDLGVTESSAALVSINNEHVMCYTRTPPTNTTQAALRAFEIGIPNHALGFIRYQSTTTSTHSIQDRDISVVVAGVSDQKGFFGVSIESSSNRHAVINDTTASTSVDITATKLITDITTRLIGGDNSGETTQYTAWGSGGKLTTTELGDYENIVRLYMQARGADVY